MWVSHCCCYTSSQYIYTNWCHTSGDSLFTCTQVLCLCFLLWLSGLSQQACDCLLLCCRCRSTWTHLPTKELLFSVSQGNRRGWSELANTDAPIKSLWFIYWYKYVCCVLYLCLSGLLVSVQISGLEHCGYCHVPLSWYVGTLIKLAGLTPSLTGCIVPAKYFLYETLTLHNTNISFGWIVSC